MEVFSSLRCIELGEENEPKPAFIEPGIQVYCGFGFMEKRGLACWKRAVLEVREKRWSRVSGEGWSGCLEKGDLGCLEKGASRMPEKRWSSMSGRF